MKMTTIRTMTVFLLVLWAIPTLVVSACALEYASGEDDAPDYGKPASVEAAPSLDKTGTETNKMERTNNTESAQSRDRLPALGYVAAQLSLIPVAFWCAVKNRNRRRYST